MKEKESWISRNVKETLKKSGRFLGLEWAGVAVVALILPAALLASVVATSAHTALVVAAEKSAPKNSAAY